MNKKELKYLEENKKAFILIFLISFSSLWLLLFFFFSWEEFAFFYAYQFPEVADQIFKTPGYSNHPILPHLSILFYLFGYNPFPYNILSLGIFFLLSVAVMFFSRIVLATDKKTSFYGALIFSSGYFGIGTFITDTYSGFTGGLGILFVILNLIAFNLLYKKFSFYKLFLFLLTYLICIKLFTSRSFALPALYSVIVLFKTRNIRMSFLIGLFFILPIIFLFSTQATRFTSAIPHINIKILDFIESLLGNIAHSFFPSLFIRERFVSVFLGLTFAAVSLYKKETRLPVLLLIVTLGAQLLAIIVNSQYFSTWQSPNHYFTSLTIFSAPIIAILLKNKQWVITVIIFGLVLLSNYQVNLELQGHSNNLRYFYETVQKYVPKREGKTVVLVYTKEPRPLDPFITLPYFSGEIYLPGFYGRNASDMKVSQSFQDSVDFMRKNNLKPDDLYVFTYALNNLNDVSKQVREVLTKRDPIDSHISIENLQVSGLVPLKISFMVREKTGQIDILADKVQTLQDYLKWHKKIIVSSIPEKPFSDRKVEYLIDNDFETTWIPENWTSPVEIILKLPEKTIINRVVWSVSRTSSWPARTPVEYNISVSDDGQNWRIAKAVKNGGKLLTNQYKIEELNSQNPISSVKFEIFKTAEGALPAIDDIQVIPQDLAYLSYEELQNFIESTKNKICLQWKTNDDTEFRFQRQACSINVNDNGKYVIEIEPRIEEVKGFRVVDKENKAIDVEDFEIIYPTF